MRLAPGSLQISLPGFAAAIVATATLTAGQQVPLNPPVSKPARTEQARKPARPQLTPQQQHGLRLLRAALAEAPGLQPEMRGLVLWQASRGYMKVDSRKSDSLLKDAFRAAVALEDVPHEPGQCDSEAEFCGAKTWLEKHIANDLIGRLQANEAEALLTSAEPEVRHHLNGPVFRRLLELHDFEGARALLGRWGSEELGFWFYYDCVARLMAALPPAQAAERLALFYDARNSFEQHADELYPMDGDFATLLIRFERDLPASVALEAIDLLLARAKEADEIGEHSAWGMSTARGNVSFESQYQLRLFQLMPILERLDPQRAEHLLREDDALRSSLKHLTQPLQETAESQKGSSPRRLGMPEVFGINAVESNSRLSDEEQTNYQIARQQEQIRREASVNPKQALANAQQLPLSYGLNEGGYSPRANALRELAMAVARSDPRVAKTALNEVRKLVALRPVRDRVWLLQGLPEAYLKLGDEDNARRVLDELLTVAEKLHERDADLSDPNQAFKAWWPSTQVWQLCVESAARLKPSPAEDVLAGVPDPEIRALLRTTLASSLLGTGPTRFSIIAHHKSGMEAFTHIF